MVTIENNAIIVNPTTVIANTFKEKVILPWYKGESAIAGGKEKAAFKKAAQNRVNDFLAFDDLDKAVKEASTTDNVFMQAQAKEAFEKACKAFGENGRLHEIQTRAFAIAQTSAKADPLGQTPLAGLGVGLSLDYEESFDLFKEALIQAVIWASRQVKNEATQAKAKAEADKKAKADIEAIFEPLFEGEDLASWFDQEATDEAFLKAGKALIFRVQDLLRTELKAVDEQGSGSTARARAILNYIEDICSDMEQGLTDKALHAKDKDGSRIWGKQNQLQIGTTARKIIEACQVRLSSLQSRVDRTLSRLDALKGAAKITW